MSFFEWSFCTPVLASSLLGWSAADAKTPQGGEETLRRVRLSDRRNFRVIARKLGRLNLPITRRQHDGQ
jgi:hypothetical protein